MPHKLPVLFWPLRILLVPLLLVCTNGIDSSSSSLVDVNATFKLFIISELCWSSIVIESSFSVDPSSSIEADRTNLNVGFSPRPLRTNDAGRACVVVGNVITFGCATVVCNDGRFSLKYSTNTGWSCLMETRLSLFFMLPECFRIESRRISIGELATDAAALTDVKENSAKSAHNWRTDEVERWEVEKERWKEKKRRWCSICVACKFRKTIF